MDFSELNSYLSSLREQYSINLYGCAVHVDSKEIYRTGNDLNGQDFFHLYSATKLFTAVAALQLVEQNRLGLYERVSDYLPAFEHLTKNENGVICECSTPLLIWHLLTMSGGFDYNDDFPEMHALLDGKGRVDSEEILSLLAARALSFEPGTHYQYSLGLDILGGVIEKTSGIPLDQYIEQNILRPAGCSEITFWPNESQYARMSDQYVIDGAHQRNVGKENYFFSARHFPSGGAGLCGTVNDYIRFLDALSSAEGNLLRPETMSLLRCPMLTGAAQREFQQLKSTDYLYTLGMRTRITSPGIGAICWDGAAGAFALADPDNRLSVFFAAHLLEFPTFYHVIHPHIRDLVYEALFDRI